MGYTILFSLIPDLSSISFSERLRTAWRDSLKNIELWEHNNSKHWNQKKNRYFYFSKPKFYIHFKIAGS
jgi:hypothetical protein